MTRAISPPLWNLWLLFMLAACTADITTAAEGVTDNFRFRRVYVPVDRLSDWPKGDALYKPMEAAEFERLVTREASPPAGGFAAQIRSARYTATLQENDLLAGEVVMDVHSFSENLVTVPLGTCGIALADVQWEHEGDRRPARLGLDAEGQLVLLVHGSGKLHCRWTLRGRRDTAGQLQFQFQLPPSVVKELVLMLPDSLKPEIRDALVSAPIEEKAGLHKWKIDVPGRSHFQLRIARQSAAGTEGRFNLLKQSLTYDLTMRGLQLDAELALGVYREPLKQLALRMDPELRLVDAHLGDQPIAWATKGRPEEGNVRTVLSFPEPIAGADRVVRLRALAPLVTEKSWQLPRIEPQGLFWQGGGATLLIARPLSIVRMRLEGCRQLRTTAVPGVAAGEAVELQYYGPEAVAELLLSTGTTDITMDSVTTFTLDDRSIGAQMVCDCRVAGSKKFNLQAAVSGLWQIESVVSRTPGVIESWSQKETAAGQVLNIYLNQGIAADKPLRLGITGRNRRSTLGRPVKSTELRMLRFADVKNGRNLLHVVAREPFRLRTAGPDVLRQIARIDLQSSDRSRLDEDFSGDRPAGDTPTMDLDAPLRDIDRQGSNRDLEGMLWLDDSGRTRFQVTLEKPSPRFSAVTRITAQVSDEKLQENIRIECTPSESSIDSIVVLFAENREENPSWSVTDAGGVNVDGVRAVRSPEKAPAGQTVGEVWTLSWNRPLGEKFQIVADRTLDLKGLVPLNLASVPQAAEQLGTVTVIGAEAGKVVVESRHLKPLPAEQTPSRWKNRVVARYRYDPDRDVDLSGDAAVAVGIDPLLERSALIWRAVAESWFTPQGSATHRITYYLENDGHRYFRASLGPGLHLNEAKIDGVSVRLAKSEATGSVSIALPENRRFAVVELKFETTPASGWFDWIRSVSLPAPELDIPILTWRRILHAPPGLVVIDGLDRDLDNRGWLNWRQRLFGPLARRKQTEVFDPFAATSWSSSSLPLADAHQPRQLVTEFLDIFGRALVENPKFAAWRQLEEIDDPRGENTEDSVIRPWEIWIDRPALMAAGIGPSSLIEVVGNRSPRQLAADALMTANLVVAVAENRLLISTVDYIQPADSTWLINGVACGGFSAPAGRDKTPHANRQAAAVRSADWVAGEGLVESPWKAIWRDGYAITESKGGTTHYLQGDRVAKGNAYLVHAAALRASQWTIFLLVAVGGCIWAPARLRWWLLLVITLAVGALLLPAILSPLATAALCGSGVAMLWQLRPEVWRTAQRRKASADRRHGDDTFSATRTLRFIGPEMFLLAVVMLVIAPAGVATEPSPAATASDRKTSIVFMPVDAENRPVGDTYYVPERLFKALHRRAQSDRTSPVDWLLTAATYRGQLEWAMDRDRLLFTELTANLQLEVFGHHAQVRIPFGPADPDRDGWKITVDGKAVRDLRRDEDGSPILAFDDPGIYQVEIVLQPKTEVLAGMQRVDIRIPALATSRLELDLPVDAPEIEIASAIGGAVRAAVRGRITAQLGSASRLSISWRDGEGAAAIGLTDVDQLLWMKIQPGAVVVDARLKLNVKDRRLRRLQFAADPQLRLLSPLRAVVDDQQVELSHVKTIPGDPQIIELQFAHNVTGIQEIRLSFLLAGITGEGNVRLPQLELLGVRSSRRWVAVSVDPSLQIDRNDVPQHEGLVPVSATMISDPWEIAEQKPALFYRQTQLGIDWSFPTTPQQSETVGLSRLSLGFSESMVEVLAEVDLETTAGHRFQYHVDVPEGFIAERVELISAGVDRLARWTISPEKQGGNRLTLFLDGPVQGKQQLVIRGRFGGQTGEMELPLFRLDGIGSRGSQVAIYRHPTVQVELQAAAESPTAAQDRILTTNVPAVFGRLVGVYSIVSGARPLRVSVRPNQTDATAIQVVSVDRMGGQWVAEVDLRISVKAGLLDVLRLRMPPEFHGPFTLEPELSHEIESFLAGEGHVLVVRPPEAISGEYRLSIRGPLNISSGDLVSCPVISTDEMERMTRYVVLPKQVDFQDVSWKTSGLANRSLPEDSQRAPLAESSVDSLVVTGSTYRAVLQSLGKPKQAPKIHLADIRVNGKNRNRYLARAVFDLEPAGLSRVEIQLPHPAARLLRAHVGGLAASPRRLNGLWELELSSENLAQSIEILYESPFENDAQQKLVAAAPRLTADEEKITVLKTLWSLTDGEIFREFLEEDGGGTSDLALKQQHERLRRMLDLLSNVTSAEPVDVLLPWYNLQVGRLHAAHRDLKKQNEWLTSQQRVDWEARQNALEERVKDLGKQLVTQGVFSSAAEFRAAGVPAAAAWDWLFASTGRLHGGIFEGQQQEFTIGRLSGQGSGLVVRVLLAIVLSSVALLIGLGRLRPERVLSKGLSVFAVAFAVALFYWLFLFPSILGLVAILITVVATFFYRWDRLLYRAAD